MNVITYIILTFLMTNIYCFSDIYYNILSEPVLVTKTYPFSFVYDQNKDFLLMEITLKVEPSINNVYVKIHQSGTQAEEEKLNINTKKGEAKLLILKSLVYKDIFIDVELHNHTALCSTIRVAEGWAKGTHVVQYNINGFPYYKYYKDKIIYDTGNCLAPKPCGLVVDLRNHCKEQKLPYVNCKTEASQYICTMSNAPEGQYNWFQIYDDNHFIGDIPSTIYLTNTNIKLFIKKELFDNNSNVVVASEDGKNVIKAKITVTATAKDNYKVYNTLKYSEATDIQFSCNEYLNRVSNYSHIHIGYINSKNNTIKTFNGTTIHRNQFKMADNGTILCCLYYTIDYVVPELHMKRYVEKKTLLIYQSKSIAKLTVNKEQTTSHFQNNWLIYTSTTFIGIFMLMLLIYMIFKKRRCASSTAAEDTVEMDNNTSQSQVLYADLDLVNSAHPAQRQNEESHYANIAGVLHPL